MKVQDLIDQLNEVEDKSKEILIYDAAEYGVAISSHIFERPEGIQICAGYKIVIRD